MIGLRVLGWLVVIALSLFFVLVPFGILVITIGV